MHTSPLSNGPGSPLPRILSQHEKSLDYFEQSLQKQELLYRHNSLSRQLLIDMRRTLSDKCEQMVSVIDWPFTQEKLSTHKIFNDLLSYHMKHLPTIKGKQQSSDTASASRHNNGLGGMTQDASHVTLPVVQSDYALRKKT